VGELTGEGAGGESGDGLAFEDRHDLAGELDAVVPGGQGAASGAGLLAGEAVGVTLSGVDEDDELIQSGGSPGGHPDAGPGFAGGAGRLPEDRFPATVQ